MKNVLERKDIIIGFKVPASLVRKLDAMAEIEGLTRSAIMRRILLQHFVKSSGLKEAAHA